MKIVILAGGTGSIALQTGIHQTITKNIGDIDVKVIVNAYDNGLSTGAVRRVMGGDILGPSDVRKNQTTRLKLEQPDSPWHKFLDVRFTQETSKVKELCFKHIDSLQVQLEQYQLGVGKAPRLLREAVDVYFDSPTASKIDYNDFSLANIIYAGFARANGNSLRTAASIMAELMNIADNVLVNDDESFFLSAVTRSGKVISDEGDIVSWGNVSDPFVDVIFTDTKGYVSKPTLNAESEKALLAADLIILSSGTQWSSLIPTYYSVGFSETIKKCSGQIIMVMNKIPDKDSPGQSGDDVIKLLIDKGFFPKGKIKVITDTTGDPLMNVLSSDTKELIHSDNQFNLEDFAAASKSKHRSVALARAILGTYFNEYPLDARNNTIVFDYDDTLVGRGGQYPHASALNIRRFCALNGQMKVAICTGNSIKSINLSAMREGCLQFNVGTNTFDAQNVPITIYADGGLNEYEIIAGDEQASPEYRLVGSLASGWSFTDDEVESIIRLLAKSHISMSKIENRGNLTISIKPIDPEYRPLVLVHVENILHYRKLNVRATGRTTIDISKRGMTKAVTLEALVKDGGNVLYVGDELESGNDEPVRLLMTKYPNLKCVSVKNPVETALFMMALKV